MENKPKFDTLIDKHGPEIYTYLWRLMIDPADTEDCFQEVFLRAFKAYPRLRTPANHRAWLYRIATNTANTHRTRRGRQASRTVDLDPRIQSDGLTTAEIVDLRLHFARVMDAVDKLPEKQRTALMLRKYQGLDYNEIAATLNCSPGSARANVYQALKKLRGELVPQERSPEGEIQ